MLSSDVPRAILPYASSRIKTVTSWPAWSPDHTRKRSRQMTIYWWSRILQQRLHPSWQDKSQSSESRSDEAYKMAEQLHLCTSTLCYWSFRYLLPKPSIAMSQNQELKATEKRKIVFSWRCTQFNQKISCCKDDYTHQKRNHSVAFDGPLEFQISCDQVTVDKEDPGIWQNSSRRNPFCRYLLAGDWRAFLW